MLKNFVRLNEINLGNVFLDHLLVSALWFQSFSNTLQLLLLIGSNVQAIDILVYGQLKYVISDDDNSGLKQNLMKISEAFRPDNIFISDSHKISLNPLIIITWLYFLIFFFAFGIILKSFFMKKDLSVFEGNFFTGLGQFHLSFGFWITNMILLDTVSEKDIAFEVNLAHSLVIIISLILIAFNFLIGIFYAIFSYNPFIGSSPFSTHTPMFQIWTLVFKAIMCLIIALFDDSTAIPWVFTTLSFVILCLRHYNLLSTFPYYEYIPMKIITIFSASSLLISGVSIFALITQSFSETGSIIFAEAFLIVFIVFITMNHFEKMTRRNFTSSLKELTTEKEILKKVFALRHLFEKMRVTVADRILLKSEVDFWGVLATIKKEVDFVPPSDSREMDINNLGEILTSGEFRNYYMQVKDTIIKTILRTAVRKLKFTNKLKMLLCYLSLQIEDQVDTPIYYLATLSKLRGTDRIMARSLHKKVQLVVNRFLSDREAQDKRLDIKSYLDLESVSVDFLQKIYSNSRKTLKFWETYHKQTPKMKELYQLNLDIEKEFDYIFSFWKKYIDPNKLFARSLSNIYSIYLNLVRNAPTLSKEIFEKYNSAHSQNFQEFDIGGPLSEKNLSSPHNITFYASMAKERLGSTLSVSPNAIDLLGWTHEDLKGVNINVLIPPFMQTGHDIILARHLDKVSNGFSSKRLYKNVSTFIKDKNGYMIPCYVYLSIYPYIHQELIYAAMIRLKGTQSNILLVNEHGGVEGFTRSVGELLDLTTDRQIKIRDICENFRIVERALENLLQLLVNQLAMEEANKSGLKNSTNRGIEALKLEIEEDSFDHLPNIIQTIEIRFHSKEKFDILKVFSVKIIPKKLWDNYFFIFKLAYKESNKLKSDTVTLKLHDERTILLHDEQHSYSPTNAPSPITPFSVALYKVSSTASNIQKLASQKSKTYQLEHPTHFAVTDKYPSLFGLSSNGDEKKHAHTRPTIKYAAGDKKLKKGRQGLLQIFDVEELGSTTSVSIKKYNSKLERAVYMIPKDRKLLLIQILSFVFIAITGGLLTLFGVKNLETLEYEKDSFDILDNSLNMLQKICEINKAMRLFKIFTSDNLFNMTLNDKSRYEFLNLDIAPVQRQLDILQNTAYEVNQIDNDLRLTIYKIDEEIQYYLYQDKITIYELDDNTGILEAGEDLNMYDLIAKINARASKFALKQKSTPEYKSNSDMVFILNNTLGNLLDVGEKSSSLLIHDDLIKLQHLVDFLLACIGIMGIFSLALFVIYVKFIVNFVGKRDQFIDILGRLEPIYIEKHVDWVKKFAFILEENKMDSKRVSMKIEKHSLSTPLLRSKTAKTVKKFIDTKGINFIPAILGLAQFLLVLFIFSAYVLMIYSTNKQNDVTKTNLNLVTTSNIYLYDFSLLSTMIYTYIDQKASGTVKNNPIDQEWKSLFSEITQAQSYLMSIFLEKDDGAASHLELQIIASETLCDKLDLEEYEDIVLCNNIAGGPLRKGIVGFVSYGLTVLDSVKSNFDISAKTDQDKLNALKESDLVSFEAIMDIFGRKIFQEFMTKVKEHVKDDIDGVNIIMRNFIIVYICVCIVFGSLVWRWIGRKLENEFTGWRKMVRQIPWDIVTSDKILKRYIGLSSKEDLNQ